MPFSKKILLDTNFLLIPAVFKVDIFTELQRICDFKYKVYILDKSIKELQKIVEKQKGKHREAAKLALILIKFKKTGIISTKSRKSVDDILYELAGKGKDVIIATQDKKLRKKIKNKGGKAIILRKKQYLEII